MTMQQAIILGGIMNKKAFNATIKKAQQGDGEALRELIEMFQPLVIKNSIINGRFDEDCFQELSIKLIKCIRNFEFDPETKKEAK